jgi:hypothetical protein
MKIIIYATYKDETVPLIIFEGHIADCPEINTMIFEKGVKFTIEQSFKYDDVDDDDYDKIKRF